MGSFWIVLYNILFVPSLRLGFLIASLFDPKIKEGLRCRKGWLHSLQGKMRQLNWSGRRILFHCASVGEWAQAVPIIEEIGKRNSDIDIIASFLSPSGFHFIKSHPNLAFTTCLPFDTRHNATRFLKTIAPDLWVISKYDAWPNHVLAAKKLRIPVVMTSASLPENSKRRRGIFKRINRQIYQNFHYIFPVSESDQKRFLPIFPYPDRLIVAGSVVFDQVYRRSLTVRRGGSIPIFNDTDQNGTVLIAGSIWPSDAAFLIPALVELFSRFMHLKAILVPHELHEEHIRDIELALAAAGVSYQRYSRFSKTGGTAARVAIIDMMGLLAKLYAQTDIAFVGGSFGPGVHNVLEAAVFGQPVLFGPRYRNSFEAVELVKAGCGFAVGGGEEIAGKLDQLMQDNSLKAEIGAKALRFIQKNRGATECILSYIRRDFDFIA